MTNRYKKGILATSLLSLFLAALIGGPVIHSRANGVAPPKPNDGGMSRGTTQAKGGSGVFGVVYTMNDGFNLQLISARYTLENHNDYAGSMPMPDEKLLIVTYAIKNSRDSDNDTGGYEFTFVDENDINYTTGSGVTRLASMGSKGFSVNFKPGQGVGQDPVANALTVAIVVPGNAKIKKIIVNAGRKTVAEEKVLRFDVAGYAGGSPKNKIAPLPKYAADPTDPSGAIALVPAPVVMGKYYPVGYYLDRLDSVTLSDSELLKGNKPDDGKVWVIATFTGKNAYSKKITMFDLGTQLENMVVKDSDGEKYHVYVDTGFRKAKRDEEVSNDELDIGEERSYRVFFAVPKDVKLKTLTFGQCQYGHAYIADLTTAAPGQ